MVSASPTVGAVFIGLICAIWLSSSVVHLTSAYLRRNNDPWQWRSGVVFLTALNTAHTSILCHSLYEYLIVHFGDEPYLSTAQWDLVAHYAIFLTVSLFVQLYFVLRISTLYGGRRRAILVGATTFLALGQTAFGVAATYSTARLPVTLFEADLTDELGWRTMASSICAVLCDIVIFLAVFKDMRTARFAVKSESFFEVLGRLLIETNFSTTVVTILSLAWDAQGHPSGISLAFAIVIPNLYLLSMLTSINRGAETSRSGVDSHMIKHASSLSDMFKGTPLNRLGGTTVSRIGQPYQVAFETPIADRYAASGGGISPEEPGWLRRTFRNPSVLLQPPTTSFGKDNSVDAELKDRPTTSASFSIYNDYLSHSIPLDERSSLSQSHSQDSHYPMLQQRSYSSSIEQAGQASSPTPRKATFGEDREVALGHVVASDGGPRAAGVAGRQPVRYGYL